MDESTYINRLLISDVDNKEFSEECVIQKFDVLVILAEPGAGKTELLESLSRKLKVSPVRASIFRNKTTVQKCQAILIDAIDEVAKIDQLAVDEILAKASDTEAHKVVLASRASEWSEARTRTLSEYFDAEIQILRLQPFSVHEQCKLFESHLPNEDFNLFVGEVSKFDLEPLLSNPLFLKLLSDAYIQSNRGFESKRKIFQDAIKKLASEHNPSAMGINRPASEIIIANASEIFAKLLLSGTVGLAKSEIASTKNFPYLGSISSVPLSDSSFVFDTQLFKPFSESDLFEPVHRIPAEYAAANYLVKKIEDQTDLFSLKRFLSIAAPKHIVRDELRGLLGWMASLGNRTIQEALIELDPYAVLANGDPTQLFVSSKRRLITRLSEVSEVDPYFRRSDSWRSFGLSDFFDSSLVGDLKIHLQKRNQNSQLRHLLLDLINGSEAAGGLTSELRVLTLTEQNSPLTRKQSLRCLLRVPNFYIVDVFNSLLKCSTQNSLELAAEIVEETGVEEIERSKVLGLLKALEKLYPKKHDTRERVIGSRYFIRDLIETFSLLDTEWFLDQLSEDLCCTCNPKREWECVCLVGISKIIGILLDHYFDKTATDNHEPERIWKWTKTLNFPRDSYRQKAPSIDALRTDDQLRQSIQWIAYSNATDKEKTSKLRLFWPMGQGHAGLQIQLKDRLALLQKAFDEKSFFLWEEFYQPHYIHSTEKKADPVRALLKAHALESSSFMKIWKSRERRWSEITKRDKAEERRYRPRRNRWEKKQKKIQQLNLEHLQKNRAQIESGKHWGWLKLFAAFYLDEPTKISDHVDDPEIQERALSNCFSFMRPRLPKLEELAELKRQSKGSYIAQIVFAACLATFRRNGTLLNLDRSFLEVALTYETHVSIKEEEKRQFENELNDRLFPSNYELKKFAQQYIEPQLSLGGVGNTSADWLSYKEAFYPLRDTLPIEWLENFPDMPFGTMDTLFNLAATHGNDKDRLIALIQKNCTRYKSTDSDIEETDEQKNQKLFWYIRHFFFIETKESSVWNTLLGEKSTVLAFSSLIGRFSDSVPGWPKLSAHKIFLVFDAFVEAWPKVELPSQWGTGDPEEETAYRFLTELIWAIGKDSPSHSLPVIENMLGDPRFAKFVNPLKNMKVEALREDVLRNYSAPDVASIVELLDNNCAATVEDLKSIILEKLEDMESWLRGNSTDPIDTFYVENKRVDENTARNRVVDRLQSQMHMLDASVNIEAHMANSKRCDITVTKTIEGQNNLLVIEVKGQWHSELYTAASAQLNERYAIHPDACGQGIYLVLWFGSEEKIAGKNDKLINSPDQLKDNILKAMPSELITLIDVFVLDVSKH